MISWIVIILVLVAMLVFFKTTGVRFGKTWTILIGSIIFFFVLTFGYLITQSGVKVSNFDGFVSAIQIYFTWLGSFFDNLGNIGGNVINTNWTSNLTG
jgi:hypothetical protein